MNANMERHAPGAPPAADCGAAHGNVWLWLAGCLVLAVFACYQCLFILRVGEVGVLTRFGRPLRPVVEPGLYWKFPAPVERAHVFDGRWQCQENAYEELFTADQQNVIVTTYFYWRIADPLLFLQRLGTKTAAETALDGLVRSCKNMVIGRHVFRDLVNPDPQQLQFAAVENEIAGLAAPEARSRYGIEISRVGILRLGLPENVAAKVYERMRAERKMAAERFRTEAESAALQIRARAELERETILTAAEVEAAKLMAEADAAAAEYYRIFETQPELAVFLRKLEALEAALKDKATVIVGTETAPFDLLQASEKK